MSSRDRIAAYLCAGVIVIAPLMLGAAPRWASGIVALLALAPAVPYVTSRRLLQQRPRLLLFAMATIAVTALQMIPLPAALVELLSPHKHDLVMANAAALGDPAPRLISLSYDVPATLVELAKLASYMAFAFACMRVGASGAGRRWLVAAVAVSGTVMAVVALGHFAVGAERVFGIYRPEHQPRYLAPLLNQNHLAGFLALTAPVSLGLAVRAQTAHRAGWIFASLVCAIVALLTESRGGAIALVLGMSVAGALFVAQRRYQGHDVVRPVKLSVVVSAAIVGVCTVVLVGVFAASGVGSQLSETRTAELSDPDSKFAAWRSALRLTADNPWTGVGRGAFEEAFTRVHSHGKTFSHVENQYLQALVDWGAPVGMALIGLLCWLAVAAAKRWRAGPVEAGSVAGLAALALHSTVDFGAELSGIALSAIALAAVLLHGRLRTPETAPRIPPALVRGALLGVGAALALAALSPLGNTVREDADELALAIDSPGARPAAEVGADMLRRHPSDYAIAGLTAKAMSIAGDRRAVPVLNRALALNRNNTGLHYLAARLLVASQRPDQALVEYALALETSSAPEPILRDLLARFPEPARAAQGLPLRAARVPLIIKTLTAIERLDVAMAYAEAALEVEQNNLSLLRQAAAMALTQGRADDAAAWAARAYEARPDARSAAIAAKALAAAGRDADARALLEQAVARADRTRDLAGLELLLGPLGDAQLAAGALDAAKRTLSRLLTLADHDRATAIACHRKLARIANAQGNDYEAVSHRRRADQLESR